MGKGNRRARKVRPKIFRGIDRKILRRVRQELPVCRRFEERRKTGLQEMLDNIRPIIAAVENGKKISHEEAEAIKINLGRILSECKKEEIRTYSLLDSLAGKEHAVQNALSIKEELLHNVRNAKGMHGAAYRFLMGLKDRGYIALEKDFLKENP